MSTNLVQALQDPGVGPGIVLEVVAQMRLQTHVRHNRRCVVRSSGGGGKGKEIENKRSEPQQKHTVNPVFGCWGLGSSDFFSGVMVRKSQTLCLNPQRKYMGWIAYCARVIACAPDNSACACDVCWLQPCGASLLVPFDSDACPPPSSPFPRFLGMEVPRSHTREHLHLWQNWVSTIEVGGRGGGEEGSNL